MDLAFGGSNPPAPTGRSANPAPVLVASASGRSTLNVVRRIRRFARPALAALATGASLSCSSSDGPSGPPPPSAGDFRTTTSLDSDPPASGAQVEATIGYTLPASAAPLGAYLAEIRFDPARVAFVTSDPAMAVGRVVNDLQARSGSIVVAGAAAKGFTDGLLFKGTFRARAAGVTPADLSLELREAADTRLREIE